MAVDEFKGLVVENQLNIQTNGIYVFPAASIVISPSCHPPRYNAMKICLQTCKVIN
jgi:hypothetical protein